MTSLVEDLEENQENGDTSISPSSSIITDEEDEEDECRVCRGPAEEGRPLYTPCLCAGSIGCVHQDCLLSWLEVTRGTKCELCSTQFNFAPKYAEGTPDNLPPLEVVSGVLHRAGKKWIPFILRVILAATLWICALPLATAYLYFGWLHRPSSLVTRFKFEYIAGDTVSGALVATVIVVSFLSLMSFADFLRIHWQQVNQRRNNNNNGEHEENEIDNNNVDDDLAEDDVVQEGMDSDDEMMDEEDDEGAVVDDGAQGLHRLIRRQRLFEDHGDNDEVELQMEEDEAVQEDAVNEQEEADVIGNFNAFRRPAVPLPQGEHVRDFERAAPNVPRVNEPLRQGARANRRPDIAADQDDAMEMEIHMALDELLGIRGPISALFRNLMWLLAFNTTYLGLFAFIPHTVGISVNSALSNSTLVKFLYSHLSKSDYGLDFIQNIISTLNAESRRLNTLLQLPDLATIVLGYLSMACMVFLWKGATSIVLSMIKFVARKRSRDPIQPLRDVSDIIQRDLDRARHELGQIREELDRVRDELHRVEGNVRGRIPHRLSVVLECAAAIVKVGILLFLKMLLLPLLLGIWLDTATLPLFNSNQENRIIFAGADLFSSLLLHWVIGITFMLLVTVSVLQLREVVHPELLAKAIRPQEPQPDLLGNLLQESGSTHAKRMLLSLGIYALLLSIHIWLPSSILVKTGIGSLLPFFQPRINYLFLPKLQIPVELLIFHLSVLACLEKYKNQIGSTQHRFLLFLCEKMNITDFTLPRTVEKFKLVGSHPVYKESTPRSISSEISNESDESSTLSNKSHDQQMLKGEDREAHSFWKELSENPISPDDYIINNINLVDSSLPIRFEAGITKRGGQRSLISAPAVIVINNSRFSSKVGGYRLRRTRKDKKDTIEFWREVPGSTISRPPDGWDDLGIGGAEVQGRWAWGNEKKSEIEEGVAQRKQFKESNEFCFLLLKLLCLLIVSWIAVFIVVCTALNAPLLIGRIFFNLLQIPDHYKHDPYGAVIGLVSLYLLSRFTSNIDIGRFDEHNKKFNDWIEAYTSPASKSKMNLILLTMALWLIVSPTFLGIMYDMCFIMARDRWNGEVSSLDLKSCAKGWLSGLLMLNVWVVMCYFGAFSRRFWQGLVMNVNENNAQEEANANVEQGLCWQGKDGRIYNFINSLVDILVCWEWDKVDSTVLLRNCMLPISKELGLLFFGSLFTFFTHMYIFPYISSTSFLSSILPMLAEIGFYRMITFRISAALVLTIRLCFVCHNMLHHWFQAAHRAARDDRYLVGEVLMDYIPDKNE